MRPLFVTCFSYKILIKLVLSTKYILTEIICFTFYLKHVFILFSARAHQSPLKLNLALLLHYTNFNIK